MDQTVAALPVTNLFAPPWREEQVSRPALLATLDAGLHCKLILVSAAAGWGKTTLIVEWMRRHAEQTCWLSLDARDAEPMRFLAHIVAALQTAAPTIGAAILPLLGAPQPPTPETLLPLLVNQIALLPHRLVLILDDYHVIEEEQTHEVVRWLLTHLPRQLTLVLLTRTDPPLSLARMRAHQQMVEVRAADLRFSAEDAARFLHQTMGLALAPAQVHTLHERTEGWIAGLQLAALVLQRQSTRPDDFVLHFTGSHRHILDYLMEEVLAGQPKNVQVFLLHSSLLHRFSAALCDAVMGRDDSAQMLEYFDRCNMFLVPLDQHRRWYRYHHLFAELLRTKLIATEPEMARTIQRRAAEWHARVGDDEEAVEYALAGGAFDHAASLIEPQLAANPWRTGVKRWLRWYRLFPPGFIEAYPHIATTFGMAFANQGRMREATHLWSQVKAEKLPLQMALLLIVLDSEPLDPAQLRAVAEQATAQPINYAARLMLAFIWGRIGDLATACRTATEAYEESIRFGDEHLSWGILMHRCRLHSLAGDLQQTHALCRMAIDRNDPATEGALDLVSLAYLAQGRVLYEWNDLDGAERYLQQAIAQAERTEFVMGILPGATMLLAEVVEARGDAVGATATARRALDLAARLDFPTEVEWLHTYAVRLQLRQGNLAAASAWLKQMRPLPLSRFYPQRIRRLLEAETRLALRQPDQAVGQLSAMAAEPTDLLTVEVWVLLALARHALGDAHHARVALETALALGEPEQRQQVFLNHGARLAPLLRRFSQEHPTHHFAQRLVALLPDAEESSAFAEPLTARERDILRRIAAGQSNKEIAEALTVALSTVKWYINAVYGKLHVRSRTQAISRARELGILEP